MEPQIVGTFAEYISIPTEFLARKPDSISHPQASTLGVAALTAYEGIHDYYKIQPGDSVLINGASGGIGTFAAQMAKALGAHVTAVCSERNHQLVRDLGADLAIDYRKTDITKLSQRFDLVFDTIGNNPATSMKRLVSETGKLVLASADNGWAFVKAMKLAKKDSEPVEMIMRLKKGRERLQAILALFENGHIKPKIDREYAFEDVIAAIDYVATKRARGKVVVNIV